jgi:hypothetical protein
MISEQVICPILGWSTPLILGEDKAEQIFYVEISQPQLLS